MNPTQQLLAIIGQQPGDTGIYELILTRAEWVRLLELLKLGQEAQSTQRTTA